MSDESSYSDPTKVGTADQESAVVLNRYEHARKDVEAVKGKRDRWYAHYRSHAVEDPKNPFRSKLFVPITSSHLKSHRPRLAAAKPRVEVWGAGDEDEIRAAMHRALIHFYWRKIRLSVEVIDYATTGLIYGAAWWRTRYKRKRRTRKRRVMEPVFDDFSLQGLIESPAAFLGNLLPFQQGPRMQSVLRDVTVTDEGPAVDLWDPKDVFPDPDGWDEDTCEYVIFRSKTTLQELEESIKPDGEPLYDKEVLGKLKELMKEGNPVENYEIPSGEASLSTGTSTRRRLENDPHKRQITLLEELCDDKTVAIIKEFPELEPIRRERNDLGMKECVRYTPDPLPREINGASMAEDLLSLQIMANILTNARLDHTMQTVHAMHTVRKSSGLHPSQLRWRGGGIIPVVNHDDIRPLETARLDYTHYREMEFIMGQAQEVSGSFDIYRGSANAAGDTATTSTILSQAAASRVGLMFQLLSDQALYRLGHIFIRYNDLYVEEPRTMRILGEEFKTTDEQGNEVLTDTLTVTPEELSQGSSEELDLMIDVAQTEPGTRQFRAQRAERALQTLGPQAPLGSPVGNKIAEGLLEGLGIDNPSRTIEEHSAWVQEQQQIAMQQAMQEQGLTPGPEGLGQELAVEASEDAGDGQL